MSPITHISVVIIADNAEQTIMDCLSSLSLFEEVILYLNNSVDSTEKIASGFGNVRIIKGPFLGFGRTKQKATSYASNKWILSLDSDECLNDVLVSCLKTKNLKDTCVYRIKRNTFYKKRKIRFCGFQNEQVIRVFNKEMTNFNDLLVHETVLKKDLVSEVLSGEMNHYSYLSISDLIQKTDSYSSLYADQNTKYSSLFLSIIKSFFCFLKVYIFRFGFLDGYVGFLIAYSSANGVFYKYLKLYEKHQSS